jgi:Holliday junction resolvase
MVNKSKVKGYQFEHEFVDMIESSIYGSEAKRIPASGAMGTSLHEPLLEGDIKATFKGLNKPIRFELKARSGATQLAVKREWMNKIKMEAEHSFAYPAVACKLIGARKADGVKFFVVLDFETFCSIIEYIGKLSE